MKFSEWLKKKEINEDSEPITFGQTMKTAAGVAARNILGGITAGLGTGLATSSRDAAEKRGLGDPYDALGAKDLFDPDRLGGKIKFTITVTNGNNSINTQYLEKKLDFLIKQNGFGEFVIKNKILPGDVVGGIIDLIHNNYFVKRASTEDFDFNMRNISDNIIEMTFVFKRFYGERPINTRFSVDLVSLEQVWKQRKAPQQQPVKQPEQSKTEPGQKKDYRIGMGPAPGE